MNEYLSIPGYLPIKQAAEQMGVTDKRVLQYILAERLPARKVQGRYLIAESAILAFQRYPHGRVRKKAVPWRTYRAGARVWLRRIEAPIKPGCEDVLSAQIAERAEWHCFPGTMQRYLSVEHGVLTLLLIWKDTELEARVLDMAVEAFKQDFAEWVDWQAGWTTTSEVMAHT